MTAARLTQTASFVMNKAEVIQLSAEAERAASRERQSRARLSARSRQAAETGKMIALVSLSGIVGVALIERLTDSTEPQAAQAVPRPRRGLLMRAGMLAVALLRWGSVFSGAWRSLTARRTRTATYRADDRSDADA